VSRHDGRGHGAVFGLLALCFLAMVGWFMGNAVGGHTGGAVGLIATTVVVGGLALAVGSDVRRSRTDQQRADDRRIAYRATYGTTAAQRRASTRRRAPRRR